MTGLMHASGVPGIGGPGAEKTVSLALQGGGAHGAFTWGVLDALLEDGRLKIEAVSGASAGAMNAVVMAEGYLMGGVEGARAQLETFWRRVSVNGALSENQRSLLGKMFGFWGADAPALLWTDLVTRVASPYDLNPLNINTLRSTLDDLIDFSKVRACEGVKLFVSATNVHTGKIEVFENGQLTVDHLMASACLPTVFQAVEIDGVPYWDGGYTGNPALFPLFYNTITDDILLVQINPIVRKATPRTAREIQDRLTEISFNAPLLAELRAVDFVARLIDEGKLSRDEYKRVLMHRIDADKALAKVSASTRLNADWSFFQALRDAGRRAAKAWLKANYEFIGRQSSIDIRHTLTAKTANGNGNGRSKGNGKPAAKAASPVKQAARAVGDAARALVRAATGGNES